MSFKLRKGETYTLFQDNELVGCIEGGNYQKLSQENCDELFGVENIESLSLKECDIWDLDNGDLNEITVKEIYHRAYTQALESCKDKMFTLEQMKKAAEYGIGISQEFYLGNSMLQEIKEQCCSFIDKLIINEIDVELDMEHKCKAGCPQLVLNGMNSKCCGNTVSYPKLDKYRRITLKKK